MVITSSRSDQRQLIVDEAKSFVGVRFCHQGRSLQGVDCAGLIYCVFNKIIGLHSDFRCYPRQLQTGMMFRKLYEYGIRISKIESGPGDIVLICFRGSSTHLGILTDRSVIHADGSFGKVVEHSRNDSMFLGCGRIAAYFRMNGVSKWQE